MRALHGRGRWGRVGAALWSTRRGRSGPTRASDRRSAAGTVAPGQLAVTRTRGGSVLGSDLRESYVRTWSFLPCPARPGSCGNSTPSRPSPGCACPAGHCMGLCALEATLGCIHCVAIEGYPHHQTLRTPPFRLTKGDWTLPLTFPLACHKIAKRVGYNNF